MPEDRLGPSDAAAAAMPTGEISEAGRVLRTVFPSSPSLVSFAEAVVSHVAAGRDGGRTEAAVLARVVEILEAALEEDDEPPAERLYRDADLLASFFQNADLLDPAAPETGVIARLVMAAVEIGRDELP